MLPADQARTLYHASCHAAHCLARIEDANHQFFLIVNSRWLRRAKSMIVADAAPRASRRERKKWASYGWRSSRRVPRTVPPGATDPAFAGLQAACAAEAKLIAAMPKRRQLAAR